MGVQIAEGDAAPEINLPTDGGGTFSLSESAGKNVVVFFYPKDDTSGCTKEAIAFTDHLDQFKKLNTEIVGISADSVAKHDKFKAKHDLKVRLASEEYGVWVEKSMYGRKYMGIERSTFLIDASGRLARVWRKVKVPGHVEDVLAAVKDLPS